MLARDHNKHKATLTHVKVKEHYYCCLFGDCIYKFTSIILIVIECNQDTVQRERERPPTRDYRGGTLQPMVQLNQTEAFKYTCNQANKCASKIAKVNKRKIPAKEKNAVPVEN